MKRINMFAVACLALVVPANVFAQDTDAAVPPPIVTADPEQLQLAREIVEQGFPPEDRMDVFGGLMQQVIAQMNVAQPELQDDADIMALIISFQQRAIDEGLVVLEAHLDGMMEAMAFGYADTFTLRELQALHSFITSPEGHGFFVKTTSVNSHPFYVMASQAYMNEYMAGVPAIQTDLQVAIADLRASRSAENTELE